MRTDLVVVGAGEEVGLVAARVVVDAVDALLVALQGEVRRVRPQAPHLQAVEVMCGLLVMYDMTRQFMRSQRTLMVRSSEAEAKTPVSLGLNLTIIT